MQFVVVWLPDALVILGLVVMSIAVYGLIWMPSPYLPIHAASKALPLGVISVLIAAMFTGEPAIITRAALIGAFLVITTPMSAHAIARSIHQVSQLGEPEDLEGVEPDNRGGPRG